MCNYLRINPYFLNLLFGMGLVYFMSSLCVNGAVKLNRRYIVWILDKANIHNFYRRGKKFRRHPSFSKDSLMQINRRIFTVVIAVSAVAATFAKDDSPASIDKEIMRVRKELMQVQTERQKNKKDFEQDRANYQEYTERTAKRMATIKFEVDSLNRQIRYQGHKRDSLIALIDNANARSHQVDISQDALRGRFSTSCDQIIAGYQDLPPLVKQSLVSSTALLKGELRGKNIDNVEALNRIQQILMRGEDITGSIQVSQESSPAPEIRGTVYRLRIGTFFEGVADTKGEVCAIWRGQSADGQPIWETIKNPSTASKILKAANIREGKALPEFITLPLMPAPQKGGAK